MIQRYNIEPWPHGGGYTPQPAPTFGPWVKYEDHQKIVEHKDKLIKHLEEQYYRVQVELQDATEMKGMC